MDDPSFYGFPVFGEPDSVKITQDAGGKVVDPDTPRLRGRPGDHRARHGFPPPLSAERARTRARLKTCLYAMTPDRDFIIDTLPEHPNVSVVVGGGHAFKFASVIGRILSDWPVATLDLSAFKINRPILQMADPPKTYMQ